MDPKTETYSFKHLLEQDKQLLRQVATDYFYKMHQDVWAASSSKRLPMIGKASQMLIIGEDLGLLAPIVPKKMEEFGLLGLRVQRMPSDTKQVFAKCHEYNWMTVCTPGTHDSPALRHWWELNEKESSMKYFIEEFGRYGEGYKQPLSGEDVQNIIKKHLYS